MNVRKRVFTLAELAAELGGAVEGSSEEPIHGPAGLEDAAPGTIVRVEHARYLEAALATPASALLVEESIGPVPRSCIRVPAVRPAFIRCLELFEPEDWHCEGVHPSACLAEDVVIGHSCSIGAGAVLGPRVRLADGVLIHPHAVVGEDVEIGAGSVVHAHAVLYPRTVVGARVRIHAGAVIGADGFGYDWSGQGHRRIPQIGRVRLEDDVEVGANTTIDRATTGETVIGRGTKIDNLVQVGHNVRTGAHCLIVSQVGIAGSTALGSGVVLAGQVGVKDHITIGDGVQVAGQAGVWGDLPPGGVYAGNPARPRREEHRIAAAMGRLPELLRRVRELERRLAERDGPTAQPDEPDPGKQA